MEPSEAGNNLRALLLRATRKTVGDANRPPNWRPHYDLRSTGSEVVLFVDLPGMDEDDIQIEIRNNKILVFGVREFNYDAEDPQEYRSIGRPYGCFRCEAEVDAPLNDVEATAKYVRGVLKLRVPFARVGREFEAQTS